jgi:DNA-binding CsgD family transcriptional regulator
MASTAQQPARIRDDPTMSDRESEVLNLMIEGLAGKEIAHKLRISLNTVRSHKARIFRKLGVGSSADAVRRALQQAPDGPVGRPTMVERPLAPLTKREREVMALFADGLTRDEISCRLNISIFTVRRHFAHAFQKLRVHNSHGAVSVVLATRSFTPRADPTGLPPSEARTTRT